MGTGERCTMKLRIAPVCDIVSVPWPTTIPSTPFAISSPIAFTSLSDDAHGGDTNSNGPSQGQAGQCRNLVTVEFT